jgi:hypothetical protein
MRVVLVGLFLLAGAAGAAQPTQSPRQFTIYVPGSSSCATFLDAREARRHKRDEDLRYLQFESFTYGYVSAYNQYRSASGDSLRSLDVEGIFRGLDQWCEQNPTEEFFRAVSALIDKRESR